MQPAAAVSAEPVAVSAEPAASGAASTDSKDPLYCLAVWGFGFCGFVGLEKFIRVVKWGPTSSLPLNPKPRSLPRTLP